MKILKRMWPFILVSLIVFYGCPWVAGRLHKDNMLVILVTPYLCFAIGFIYSYLDRLSKVLPILCVIMAIPAIFLFYTSTAWSYPIFFGLSILVGECAAVLFEQIPGR
ncbi:MAG: hypothetical protein Q4G58_17215 [bacterium]|nr:hypothetical protein [bacterium]